MNITRTEVTGFEPYDLTIHIEDRQEEKVLAAIAGTNLTIPAAIWSHTDSKDLKTGTENFLHMLKVALRNKNW